MSFLTGSELFLILEERGIELLKDIPSDIKLTPRHEKMVLSIKRRKPIIDKTAIKKYLGTLVYPLYYFDFETINPAIPPFDNWKPYQTTPFQFSLHIQAKERRCYASITNFCRRSATDPREPLIKRMIELLGKKGSIIAWTMSFEKSKIKVARRKVSDVREAASRFAATVLGSHASFQSGEITPITIFMAAHQLKKVLPVLVPSLSYGDLEIQEGGTASLKYERWLFGEMEAEEWEKTYQDLLNYCKLDTLAMVEILKVLQKNI